MARVKATTTDIHAKLARGECANFMSGCCQGRTPCTVVNGAPCNYFTTYVQPLLEHVDFAGKYARAAKIAVDVNPRTKVVRKRRDPALGLNTPVEAKAAPAPRPSAGKSPFPRIARPEPPASRPDTPVTISDTPVTTRVTVSGDVRSTPTTPAPPTTRAAKQPAIQQTELFLEFTPAAGKPRKTGKRMGR